MNVVAEMDTHKGKVLKLTTLKDAVSSSESPTQVLEVKSIRRTAP